MEQEIYVGSGSLQEVLVTPPVATEIFVSGALQGEKGNDGNDGIDGTDGSRWYWGSGAPSELHNNGDFYVNFSTGDVYEQVGNAWNGPIGNIKGADAVNAVTGPSPSTDNAIPRFDGTNGTVLQNSSVLI